MSTKCDFAGDHTPLFAGIENQSVAWDGLSKSLEHDLAFLSPGTGTDPCPFCSAAYALLLGLCDRIRCEMERTIEPVPQDPTVRR